MGDRANVFIPESPDAPDRGVYLYTHWGGYDLPTVVQTALAKEWRWNDTPYLARILFDQMTAGDHGTETGFGISTRICDNEHPIIVVDTHQQTVQFVPAKWDTPPAWGTGPRWSFTDYCALTDEQIETAWLGREADES